MNDLDYAGLPLTFGGAPLNFGEPSSMYSGFLQASDPRVKFGGVPVSYGGRSVMWGSTLRLGLIAQQTEPDEDDPLDDVLQETIKGITGIAGNLVRPRWQEEPANLPAYGVNWAAFGRTETETPLDAVVGHHYTDNPSGEPTEFSYVSRSEEVVFLVSFYGPESGRYASRLRDGLALRQNLERWQLESIGLAGIGPIRHVPDLIKNKWTNRSDIEIRVRRSTVRTYSVTHLLSACGVLHVDERNNSAVPYELVYDGKPLTYGGRGLMYTGFETAHYSVSFRAK